MQQLELLPAQKKAFDTLSRAIAAHNVVVLTSRTGAGKTTILRALHARLGGEYLTSREFIEASVDRDPLALDETVYQVLKAALLEHPCVIVDDFHLVVQACYSHGYPRSGFLAAALAPVAALARDQGKTLVFATEGMPLQGLHATVATVHIPKFDVADYAMLCASYLGADRSTLLDLRKVHRFALNLNARQLRNTCEALRDEPALDTERFVEYLRENHLASNVDLGEVQVVDLSDLKGIDDVLEALEANVILPLENAEVAEELKLKPKRGVLLAGPPGTGKTTIGRALAHRLKSKFFLIDGTVISGTPDFFMHVHQIFEAAKQNAPGIIFIDDSDVIFRVGQDTGFYRYLLTMLDGLESASAGRICLMMTAMDVGSLPAALVRSGRIELWLETRLPDEDARRAILAEHCADMPPAIGAVDLEQLAPASAGLSGADLKRVVEDGKLLFAFERTRNARTLPATEYFLRARSKRCVATRSNTRRRTRAPDCSNPFRRPTPPRSAGPVRGR